MTRRVHLAACAIALSALPVPARAGTAVLSAFAVQYVPQQISIERGDDLLFANADPLSLTDGHDVIHDAPPHERRFGSDVALVGSAVPVNGVPSLYRGRYEFFCSRHNTMRGVLVVGGGYAP